MTKLDDANTDPLAEHGAFRWLTSLTLVDMRTGEMSEATVVGPEDGDPYVDIDRPGRFALHDLSHAVSRPYMVPRPQEGFRKLESFTEGQRKALYPFALVLACLDGNAFVNHAKPEDDLVWQYIPEAFATLAMNGCVQLTDEGARFESDPVAAGAAPSAAASP